MKLEALRRGYDIGPVPEGAVDDFDAIAEEAVRNIEQRRRSPGQDSDTRTQHDQHSTPNRAWAPAGTSPMSPALTWDVGSQVKALT